MSASTLFWASWRPLDGLPGLFGKPLGDLSKPLGSWEALEAVAGSDEAAPGDARMRDAMMALIALGYKQADALKMVRKAAEQAGPDADVEGLIKRSLAG